MTGKCAYCSQEIELGGNPNEIISKHLEACAKSPTGQLMADNAALKKEIERLSAHSFGLLRTPETVSGYVKA
jgi:hypothetical protein